MVASGGVVVNVTVHLPEPAAVLAAQQAECEASMMHGSELADARAAVWQSAAGRLLEVRDAADNLVRAHVRRFEPASYPNPQPNLTIYPNPP